MSRGNRGRTVLDERRSGAVCLFRREREETRRGRETEAPSSHHRHGPFRPRPATRERTFETCLPCLFGDPEGNPYSEILSKLKCLTSSSVNKCLFLSPELGAGMFSEVEFLVTAIKLQTPQATGPHPAPPFSFILFSTKLLNRHPPTMGCEPDPGAVAPTPTLSENAGGRSPERRF